MSHSLCFLNEKEIFTKLVILKVFLKIPKIGFFVFIDEVLIILLFLFLIFGIELL